MSELLACQRDPYLRVLETRVLSREGDAVVLEDTLLYPGGGGQPPDSGTVGGVAVARLGRDQGGRVLHHLEGPLDGEAVTVAVDWPRRFDIMQQHTAQHLLTALAEDLFGAPTMSFHLSDDYSAIELDAVALPLDELAERANDEIRAARPVSQRSCRPEELASLRVRTRGLPDGFRGDRLRLIEIEGLDLNTCGGTHVASTAELQTIVLLGTEKIRSRLRLRYLAGGRVAGRLSDSLAREQALTERLTCGPGEHIEQLDRIQSSLRERNKEVRQLRVSLADSLGEKLAGQADSVVGWSQPDADLPFLQQVASQFEQRRPDCLLVLVGAGVFLVAGPEAVVAEAGPVVMQAIDGRGGGRGGRLQGKAGSPQGLTHALTALR